MRSSRLIAVLAGAISIALLTGAAQGSTQNARENTRLEAGSGEGDQGLYQRFTALENELPTLAGMLTEARKHGIPVDYPTVDYSTIARFISVGRSDVAGGQSARAQYIAGVLEGLYTQATNEVQGYLDGTAKPMTAPRYATGSSRLSIRGRSFVGDTQVEGQPVKKNQTVFLTGYGHGNEAEVDIPRFQGLGTDAMQTEIGPNSTIFPASTPGWQPSANALRTTFARDTSTAHSGQASLVVGDLSGAQGGASGALTETFGTTPDTTYEFSLWVKGSDAGGTVTVSAGGNGVTLPGGSYGWKQITFSYTTGDEQNTVPLTISASAASGSTWVDDIAGVATGSSANVIDNGGFERSASAGALFAVDDTLVRTRITADLAAADCSDVAVNLLLSPHYMPQFVYDETPNLGVMSYGFLHFDINNPVAKQVIAAHIHAVMSVVKSYPSMQSITLTNEPVYTDSTTSQYTRQLWHEYLQRTYSSVTAMNATWGTSYASFDAAPPSDGDYQASPYFYDWVQFNNQMLSGWHAWMAKQVHAVDKTVPVQAKIMVFYPFGVDPFITPSRGQDTLGWGVDPEQFDNLGQISGDDDYGILQWGPAGYVQENLAYDLQSSMKAAPVFNSEDHIVWDNDTDYEPLQATNARMTQWQGAIHGRSGSTIWTWTKNYNSILVRPDVADQVGRTGLDLNRLAAQVTAFQNAKPSVGILYSIASDLYTPGNAYAIATNAAYKALLYDGQKPGFVSENQAAHGGLNKYHVLVLPRTTNVSASTLRAIHEFEMNGGKVVIVGDDALTADEHDKPLDPAVRQAVIDGAAQQFDATVSPDTLQTKLLTDLQQWGQQRVTLVDADTGQPVSGVEYETATYDGDLLLNIASYDAQNTRHVYVELDGKRLSTPVLDLISGKRQDTQPLTLAPISPLLLKLPNSGHAGSTS